MKESISGGEEERREIGEEGRRKRGREEEREGFGLKEGKEDKRRDSRRGRIRLKKKTIARPRVTDNIRRHRRKMEKDNGEKDKEKKRRRGQRKDNEAEGKTNLKKEKNN